MSQQQPPSDELRLRQETELLELLAKHCDNSEILRHMAGLCYTLELNAPTGSGYAYGAHACGDKIALLASRFDHHLKNFGKP